MKVHANQYLQFLNKNYNNHNIIFLYGTNNGLVNILFRDTIKSLKIDENNPFLVSKIDGDELKENPTVLSDNLATISMFGEKKVILLNLLYTTITQTIEKLISDNITQKDNDFVLIIKAGNLSSKSNLIKFLQKLNNCILVPCYDEEPEKIKTKILNYLINITSFFQMTLCLIFTISLVQTHLSIKTSLKNWKILYLKIKIFQSLYYSLL